MQELHSEMLTRLLQVNITERRRSPGYQQDLCGTCGTRGRDRGRGPAEDIQPR
jgi:hypothetical protein